MANITTINDDEVELKVAVTIPNSEYDDLYNIELENIAKDAKFDGFRKGKVPKNIIKAKFDAQCHQKSISSLIDLHTTKINSEKKLELIDTPSVKLIETPSKEKELSFEITFNKMPNIDISIISKIKLTLPDVTIQSNDIDSVIDNILKQNYRWEDSNKSCQSGDKVVMDYVGKIDDKDFPNNKQDDFTFIVDDLIKGDNATVDLFKQFSKNCLGKDINSKFEVTHQMPTDFPDKELCGKVINYSIFLKKILKGIPPKLDKDFFTKLGIDTDDINVFKERVKEHMQFELNDKLHSVHYGLVNEALVNDFSFDPPKSMLEKNEKELNQQYASLKNDNKDMSTEIHNIAIKRVKLNIIYIKLSKEIDTNISDESAIEFCNKQSPSFRRFYSDKLKKDKAATLSDIKNKIIENNIVDYVINKSTITKEKRTFSELMDG